MLKCRFFFVSIHILEFFIFLATLLVGLLAGTFFLIFRETPTDAPQSGRLAIVIDDFGLQRKGVIDMLSLDCKLTVAVMPFLQHSEDDAEDALESGKEVIIHIPMQATNHDIPSHLGPRPILITSTEKDIENWLHDAIEELPGAVGANIHMGTLSSTRDQIIRSVFLEMKEHGLYFLDSKTSSKSVCRKIAGETEIYFYENEVFLEHEMKTLGYIKKRLRKAMNIAKNTGSCIAIGHVGYEGGSITAQAIREMLDEFSENRVELVFVSELTPMEIKQK